MFGWLSQNDKKKEKMWWVIEVWFDSFFFFSVEKKVPNNCKPLQSFHKYYAKEKLSFYNYY